MSSGAPRTDLTAGRTDPDDPDFSDLVHRHRDRLYRVALHTVGDPHQAEDLTQEVFLRLYRSLPGFRGEAEVGTWLYRVTVNLCRDHLRARGRAGVVSMEDARRLGALRVESDPVRTIELERLRTAVREALDRLPAEQREAVLLRYMADLPYSEIARITDAPQGTVASRVFRALRALGELVERRHLEGIP